MLMGVEREWFQLVTTYIVTVIRLCPLAPTAQATDDYTNC